MTLSTTVDATYGDDPANASQKQHQQDHDVIHTAVNAINAGTYRRTLANTVGVIGDSISNNIGDLNGYRYNTGYWAHVGLQTGHRTRLTYLDGVAGSGCLDAGWAGRVANLAASSADIAVVEIGTNDVQASGSTASITTALGTTLTTLRNAGKRIVILTVPPRNGLTAAQQAVQGQVNTWIRQTAATYKDTYVADITPYLTDATSSTPATYVTAYSSDGTHPTPLGCQQMAKAIGPVINALTPPVFGVVTSQSDASNLLAYSSASWAGGTTGQPTGWGQTNTGLTWSQVSRTDGVSGIVQRVVVPVGGTCTISAAIYPGASGYSVGDRIVGFLEVYAVSGIDPAPAANTQYMSIDVDAYNPAYAVVGVVADMYKLNTQPNVPPVAGLLQTPTMVIPSTGTQEVDILIRIGAGGTYDLGRVGIVKVGSGY